MTSRADRSVPMYVCAEAAGSGEARPAALAPDAGVAGGHRAVGLSGANKRMLHLLKKAKVQLIKIDQQKQFKLSQVCAKFFGSPPNTNTRKYVLIATFTD